VIAVKAFLVLAGYALALTGGGFFVEWALAKVLREGDLAEVSAFRRRGLANGGRAIGWLERFLFVTFVLLENVGALGLVLAAKGVIRFGEVRAAKDQKVAEYVLVGTLLSLSWALVVGLALRWLIR
jgi:hypothetical protein